MPQGIHHEYCLACGEMTGRSGASDDSSFCACGSGPFCEGCYEMHICNEKERALRKEQRRSAWAKQWRTMR
jgi:hypothetical protein